MSRIPLSWVNSLLDNPVEVGIVDLVLGEMGVVVNSVTGVGAACRDVVVGEVLSEPGQPLVMAVPTPERVALPSDLRDVPARGTKVAVALPGALVMRAAGGETEGPYGTFRAVVTGSGQAVRVGRVCVEADLAEGGAPELAVLPEDSTPGAPVRDWLPRAWGDDVLSVRLPPGVEVAGRVAELAEELVRRGIAGRSTPVPRAEDPAPGHLVVDIPGITAAAVLIAGPEPDILVPEDDRRRHRSVGIPPGPSAVDEYLAAAAFETGLRFDRRRSAGGVPAITLTGADQEVQVSVAESGPAEADTESWIVTVWGPSAVAGADDCRRALIRVCRWLGVTPQRSWDGVGAEVAPLTRTLAASRFQAVTGMPPTAADLGQVLRPAGIRVTLDGADRMSVRVPASRADIVDEETLVEEVVRRIGLSRLPGVATRAEMTRDRADHSRAERAVRRRLQAAGWTELVTPMVVPADAEALAASRLLGTSEAVRDSVLPGLLVEAGRPAGNGGVFEIGSIYTADGSAERRVLGLVREVDPAPAAQGTAPGDEMRLLGLVARTIHGPDLEWGPLRRDHQGEWRALRAGGRDVGSVRLGAMTGSTVTLTAEIEFASPSPDGSPTGSALGSGRRPSVIRQSSHPAALRDLTVMLPTDLSAVGFRERLTAVEPLVADVALVDRYRDPDSLRMWLTFRMTLSSRWRSIPRSEARELMVRVARRCDAWGVAIRE